MDSLSSDDVPFVTIVIPAFNEAQRIPQCLQGVQDLDYPRHHYEVLVVDNGSEDETGIIAARQGALVLDFPGGLVGGVRNHGAANGRGAVIAFLDSDCVPDPAWLREGVKLLGENPSVGAVGGDCIAPQDGNWMEKAWAREVPAQTRVVPSLAASSLILRRADFDAVGGFDESLNAGEDDDLSSRLTAQGFILLSHPRCTVAHLGWPKSFREVFDRQRWQGGNQLKTARWPLDKNLLLFHAFLLFGLIPPFLFLFPSTRWLGILGLLFLLTIPGIAAVYRTTDVRTFPRRATKTILLYPIFLAYYSGRAAGLVREYSSLVLGRSERPQKTWARQASPEDDRESGTGKTRRERL